MTKIMATIVGNREGEFVKVLGSATVPVTSADKVQALLNGVEHECFMIDFLALPDVKQLRLVEHLALKFNAPEWEVWNQITNFGLPLRASDCVLSVDDPPRVT